jgi:hypothetical protein
MLTLAMVQGSARDWPLQAIDDDGSIPTGFLFSDALNAVLWSGQDQAILFSPAVAWTDASTAQFQLSITNAQSESLEPTGTYHIQVNATRGDKSVTIADFLLQIAPSPGFAIQQITTYCSYQDVLNVASWIARVQATDFDQEGFYTQRLQARQWMDQSILNAFRGAFVGLFESHSTAAFAFGYAGWRRSLGPSPSLQTYLQQGKLMIKPPIVQACAHWTASLKGLSQVGLNNQLVSYGCYHRDMAERLMTAITAEVDLNNDGVGEMFIILGQTNTLYS